MEQKLRMAPRVKPMSGPKFRDAILHTLAPTSGYLGHCWFSYDLLPVCTFWPLTSTSKLSSTQQRDICDVLKIQGSRSWNTQTNTSNHVTFEEHWLWTSGCHLCHMLECTELLPWLALCLNKHLNVAPNKVALKCMWNDSHLCPRVVRHVSGRINISNMFRFSWCILRWPCCLTRIRLRPQQQLILIPVLKVHDPGAWGASVAYVFVMDDMACNMERKNSLAALLLVTSSMFKSLTVWAQSSQGLNLFIEDIFIFNYTNMVLRVV